MPQIQIYKPNAKNGDDYFMGDIHGEITILAHVVLNLNPNDRLFLVGDLCDRGDDSHEVFKFIEYINVAQNRPQIISIRGNHEQLLLSFIKTRLYPLNFSQEEIDSSKELFIINGGNWALNLSRQEMFHLEQQIEKMPIIIWGEGEHPFQMVHADFDDEIIENKIEKYDFTLTTEQMQYALWARVNDPQIPIVPRAEKNRKPRISYCGHHILAGVRANSNSVNLDAGSFCYHHIFVVNHTKGVAAVYTTDDTFNPLVWAVLNQINAHLKQVEPRVAGSKVFESQCKLKKKNILSILPSYIKPVKLNMAFTLFGEKQVPSVKEYLDKEEVRILSQSLMERINAFQKIYQDETQSGSVNLPAAQELINSVNSILLVNHVLAPNILLNCIVVQLETLIYRENELIQKQYNVSMRKALPILVKQVNETEGQHFLRIVMATVRDVYKVCDGCKIVPVPAEFSQLCSKELKHLVDAYEMKPLTKNDSPPRVENSSMSWIKS